MKANKAPEKIYIQSFNVSEEDAKFERKLYFDDVWTEEPESGQENIEYTRTDAFIEKSYDFIRRKICDYIIHYNYGPNNDMETMYVDSRFFEDFKNYMKGE